MSVITFAEAKKLVLERLRQHMAEMPVAERRRPRYIINFTAYSILDLIAEVERETEVGREYVFDQAKRMDYVVD